VKAGTAERAIEFSALMDLCKAQAGLQAPRKGDFIIEGYVATNDLDLQNDQILDEALKGSEKDLEKNSTVLDNHDPNKRIGVVLKSELRPGGLWIQVRISETVPHIRKQIEEGVLNKFSIKGQILDAEPKLDAETGRVFTVIKKLYLTHASLVSVPANTNAESLRHYIVKSYLNATGGEGTMDDKDKKDGKDGKTTETGTTGATVEKTETPAAPTDGAKPGDTAGQTAGQTTTGNPDEVEKANIPGVIAALDAIKAAAPAVAAQVDKVKEIIAKWSPTTPNGGNGGTTTPPTPAKSEDGGTPAATPAPGAATVKSDAPPTPAPAAPAAPAPQAIAPELEKSLGKVVECLTSLGTRIQRLEKMAIPVTARKSFIGDGTETGKGNGDVNDKSRPVMDRLRDAVGAILKPEVR